MSSLIRLDVFPFTDKGRREYQEDFLYTDPVRQGRPWLGIVSDGMGGHQGGDVASKAGVHALRIGFEAALAGRIRTEDALVKAVTEGHEAVLQAAANANAVDNMGATVVAFVIDGETLHWCTAGDSRLYLFRNGKVKQLSRDFTVGEDMKQGVEKGEWTQEEIDRNPQRNALTSFMGTDNWRFDARSTPLRGGDIVIACSDGVYGTIDIDGIASACLTGGSSPTAQQIAESMMKRILDVGKSNQDNSTAIVVRYEGAKSASINGLKPVELTNPPVATKSQRTRMPWIAGGLVVVAGLASVGLYVSKLLPPQEKVANFPAHAASAPTTAIKIEAESDGWLKQVEVLEKQFELEELSAEDVSGAVKSLKIQLPNMPVLVREQVRPRLVALRDKAMKLELESVKNKANADALVSLKTLINRWSKDSFSEPDDIRGRELLADAQAKLKQLEKTVSKAQTAAAERKAIAEKQTSDAKKKAGNDRAKAAADDAKQKVEGDIADDVKKKVEDDKAKAAAGEARKKAEGDIADDAKKKVEDDKAKATAEEARKKADENKAKAGLAGKL